MTLYYYQLRGMDAGLTREQVENDWFNWQHAKAAEAGISYDQYQGLTNTEVECGILKGLTRDEVVGLNVYQLRGMAAGLTRQQVEHNWFGWGHALAARVGFRYEQYRGLVHAVVLSGIRIRDGLARGKLIGLDDCQLRGVAAGLTPEQVENTWFSDQHLFAAEAGIPYEQYQGLDDTEVEYGICQGFTRQEIETLKLQGLSALTPGLRLEFFHNWFDFREIFIKASRECQYLLANNIITELQLFLSFREENRFLSIQKLVNESLRAFRALPANYTLEAKNTKHLIELIQGVAEIRKNSRQLSRPVAATSSSCFKFFPDILKQKIAAYTGNASGDEVPIAIQYFKKP